MNKKVFALALILCFSFSGADLFSQFKYWIRLKDKTGTPYTTSNPSLYLTAQSIQRRVTYNIGVDVTDLPVNSAYVNQIDNVPNVTVLYASKWLNGVVVSIPDKNLAVAALATISTFSFVINTDPVKKYKLDFGKVVKVDANANIPQNRGASSSVSSYSYGGSYWQNEQLNVICMHEQGYRGQNMTIAVLDAGFTNVNTGYIFDSLNASGRLLGGRNFADGGTNVFMGSDHGTMVMSCMAANVPGKILGSAPLAKYWLLRTEEATETISEEYNWIRGAEFADSVGADILTTSLGYTEFDDPLQNHTYATLNGRTAPMSIAATMAARKGMFVLNAAGNEGSGPWHYISVPGDADSICTVGAIDSAGVLAAFSSVGPTSDGRIKPDLVARGAGSWVSPGSSNGFPGNGTSFATPILAGAVACYWQAHKNLNNMKVLDTLKKGASNPCFPNNSIGWGIPKMCPVVSSSTISGSAFLRGNNNHSGIKVKFITDTLTGTADSTYTNSNGTYSIVTNSSYAKIVFSKSPYITSYYKNNSRLIISRCSALGPVTLSTVAGPAELVFDFTAYIDPTSQMSIQLSKMEYEYVTVEIYDLNGRILLTHKADPKNYKVQFDAINLANAIYLVKVKTSQGTKTKKVLKRT